MEKVDDKSRTVGNEVHRAINEERRQDIPSILSRHGKNRFLQIILLLNFYFLIFPYSHYLNYLNKVREN